MKEKTVKNICDADNKNQRFYRNGWITKKEYEQERQRIHDEYMECVAEERLLERIMKKHGG